MSRVPPYSAEMEEAVVGCMLLGDVGFALDMLAPDDFHVPAHGAVFRAFVSLSEAGDPLEVPLLAEVSGVPPAVLKELRIQTPASQSTRNYVRKVAELGAFRRAIALGEELIDAAYGEESEKVDKLLADPMERLLPRWESGEDAIEASELAKLGAVERDWIVRGLLGRMEVVLWVGEPGAGKSTLLRQFGVCVASGLHPFTLTTLERPLRVLIVDCQESREDAGMAIGPLLRLAGAKYQGGLSIIPKPQGIDLTAPRWQRWLDGQVKRHGTDLLLLGPLYNMLRGAPGRSKQSEETAEIAASALGDLMVRRNVAIMIEAHAPHGDEMRVRGSKLWEDFPAFGFGLIRDHDYKQGRAMDLRRFRGDRYTGRAWPTRYVQSDRWPWVCPQRSMQGEMV